jgi:hypothetical protein
MASGIRPPAVAGSFYPASPEKLKSQLADFFSTAKKLIPANKILKALIVPHAGYVYSGQTAAWGYAQLPKTLDKPHFVLLGPSHHAGFDGLAASSHLQWQTPLGLVNQIPAQPVNDSAHLPEHCLEVQLPFLQYLYPDFSITCLLTNWLPQFTINLSQSILIVSSDLSHYLPGPEAKKQDRQTIDAILNLDLKYFSLSDNLACGSGPIVLLIGLARRHNWQARLINYSTSADASGDTSAVVGYAAIAFYV